MLLKYAHVQIISKSTDNKLWKLNKALIVLNIEFLCFRVILVYVQSDIFCTKKYLSEKERERATTVSHPLRLENSHRVRKIFTKKIVFINGNCQIDVKSASKPF